MKSLFISVLLVGWSFAEQVEQGCRYKGNVYKKDEIWTEKDTFKMRCIFDSNGAWRAEVTGCMTPSGLVVPFNSTKEENGMDWSCESSHDGGLEARGLPIGSIVLKQRNRTEDCIGGHKKGEKWIDSYFEFECGEGGVQKFLGCITPKGVRIADGEIKEIDGHKLECKMIANRTVGMGMLRASANVPEEVKVEQGCRHKGNVYKKDQIWTEKGAFKVRCIVDPNGSWRTDVIACVTPSGLEVPINSTKDENDFVWICEAGHEGSLALKQKRNNMADCPDGHKNGERWVESSFEFECWEGGVQKFLGCVTPKGDKIADGEIKEIDGNRFQCKLHANGTVALGVLPKEKYAHCFGKGNIYHAHGSTWVENVMFEYKCEHFGVKTFKGCIVKEYGLQIPIGETRHAGNTLFHCDVKDGAYRFYTSKKSDRF